MYTKCIQSYQLKLIKMRAELANLNHSAVPFLSRTAVNLLVRLLSYLWNIRWSAEVVVLPMGRVRWFIP